MDGITPSQALERLNDLAWPDISDVSDLDEIEIYLTWLQTDPQFVARTLRAYAERMQDDD